MAAAERWPRRQHDNGDGSVGCTVAALAERQRQRGSSAAMVGRKPDRNSPSLDNDKKEGICIGRRKKQRGQEKCVDDASLDNGKEEGDLHWATINRGGRRNASGDASLDNGKGEGDALGDASNAPPG